MKSLDMLENLIKEEQRNRDKDTSEILEQIEMVKEATKTTYTIPQKDTIGRDIYTLLLKH